MASLSAHLRQPGDHGRLAFHPDCAVCRRDRVAGRLDATPLVSLRAQALVVSGMVAASVASPAAALAAETEQEKEGAAAPEQVVTPEGSEAEQDPGGETTELPVEVATPAPPAVTSEDGEPLEAEPTESVIDVTSAPETSVPVPAPSAAEPPPAEPSPTPAASPVPAAPPSAPAPVPSSAPVEPAEAPQASSPRHPTDKREARTKAAAPSPPVIQAPQRAPGPVAVQRPAAPPTTAVADRAKSGDRSHAVQPGESLWSISRDMLGEGASPARVARQVNRLWTLNHERIGTGDPDLLMIGTELRLR